jgi:hypothetical protein
MPERIARTFDPRAVDSEPGSGRLRFEVIIASVWLALGLFLVPALIFWVGITLLGPYGDGAVESGGLGSFYADFFGDLASGEVRAWALALGPLIIVSLVRLVFVGTRRSTGADADSSPPPAPARPVKSTDHRRVEPRIDD